MVAYLFKLYAIIYTYMYNIVVILPWFNFKKIKLRMFVLYITLCLLIKLLAGLSL